MAGNLVKRVMLKIVADDGDSEAKLDKITAKAEELGRLHPELKVRVDAAAASAKLAVLKSELKDATNQANQPRRFSLSGILPAIGQMGLFQKLMLGLGAATTFAEPLMAGLTVGTMGLASGLTAAGIGLGAFGLVAKSAISNVTPAVNAYETALNTSGKAAARAMLAYHQYYAALSPGQKIMAQGMITAENAWNSFVQSNTSGVSKIMSQGFGLLPKLFSTIQPLMAPVEGALHVVIGQLSHGLDSSGFRSFMASIRANTGPAIVKLSDAIGHIVAGIGGILKAFMPASQGIMSGLDKITAKFARWGQTLSGHSGFQSLMTMFRTETPIAVRVLGNLGGIIKTVVADMTGLSGVGNSKTLLQIADPFTSLLKVLVKANPDLVRVALYLLAAGSAGKKLSGVFGKDSAFQSIISGAKGAWGALQNVRSGFTDSEAAASAATGIWGTFGGKLSVVTGMIREQGIVATITSGIMKVWTSIQAAFNVVMAADPIVLVVGAVALLAAGITLLIVKCKPFRDFWVHLWHDVVHIVDDAVGWIRGHWPLLLGILTGPIGLATVFIVQHFGQIRHWIAHTFDDIRHDIASWGMDVVHWFQQLPGRIVHALGNLGSLLVNAGESLMTGFLHGIAHGYDNVRHFVAHIADDILSLKGPMPRDQVLLIPAGQAIMTGLLAGLNSKMPDLHAQIGRTTAALAVGGGLGSMYGAAAGRGGPQRIEIVLQVQGGDGTVTRALAENLKAYVRNSGGGGPQSVQIALGQTH